MKVTRKNNLNGNINSMELDVTQEQLDRYDFGEDLVQDIFPNLTPSEREFLITGITPNDWNKLFFIDEK